VRDLAGSRRGRRQQSRLGVQESGRGTRPVRQPQQVVQLRFVGLELGAEGGLTSLQVEAQGLLASSASRSCGKSPGEEDGLGFQPRLSVALQAEVGLSELGVCNGSTKEIVVSLGFLGASGPGELKGTGTSCLSLVSGDAILLKAEGASGLLGGTSGLLGLAAATASRVRGGAATLNVNNGGVLGTLLHESVTPARRAEGNEDERGSGSGEKRLQYWQQGAAS
jgi:hypothetical protein